jgi:hypothetical protein
MSIQQHIDYESFHEQYEKADKRSAYLRDHPDLMARVRAHSKDLYTLALNTDEPFIDVIATDENGEDIPDQAPKPVPVSFPRRINEYLDELGVPQLPE